MIEDLLIIIKLTTGFFLFRFFLEKKVEQKFKFFLCHFCLDAKVTKRSRPGPIAPHVRVGPLTHGLSVLVS